MAWLPFLIFSAGQIAFVAYVRRHGPPALVWTGAVVVAAVSTLVVLGIASERTSAQLLAREGLPPLRSSAWENVFDTIRWSTGPTLWIFALCQAALMARPRSHPLVTTLTVLSGAALSWAVAIWLILQPLPEIWVRLLLLPGMLGIVASSLGFAASGGIWMIATRLRSGPLSNPHAV